MSKAYTIVSEVGGTTIVRFADLSAVRAMDQIEEFGQELMAIAERSTAAIILDFQHKEFLPIGALEVTFLRFHKRLAGRLKMCSAPPQVLEHFQMNQLATVFDLYRDLAEALAAVRESEG